MNRFLSSLVCMAICYTAWSQDFNVAIVFSLPPQVEKVFRQSALSKTYEFTSHVNPYYLQGDFNGDGRLDTAVLIKEKATGKVGIAIFHGGSNKIIKLGRSEEHT